MTEAATVLHPAALVSRARASLRGIMPTLALRHAGGSWLDVLSHPAFRLELQLMQGATTKEAAAVHRVPMACHPHLRKSHQRFEAMGPHLPGVGGRGVRSGNGGDGGLYGKYGPGVLDAMSMSLPASFVSSSGALRHAGCSWFDVARHAAFHACVRSRVLASGYAVYVNTFVKHPFTSALVTSVTKCVTSDIAVQYFVEGKDELDMKRVFCFFTLGLTYVGAFQYGLYNNLMKPMGGVLTRVWGTGASVGMMVAIDTFVVCPFIYLPTFYGLKMWANGECTVWDVPKKVSEQLFGFGGGDDSGKEEMGRLTLVALWAYWMPAQAINFWVVPRHLTIPFMNLLGFFWNGIMSALNGDTKNNDTTARTASEEERSTRREVAVAAVAADAKAATDVGSNILGKVAGAQDCLQNAGCLHALTLATMDALAIVRVGDGVEASTVKPVLAK